MTHSTTVAIRIDLPISTEFIRDVAITAAEGGIGYWATLTQYKWQETKLEACLRQGLDPAKTNDSVHRQQLDFPIQWIEPNEDCDRTFEETVVTPEMIVKGIDLEIKAQALRGSFTLLMAVADNDAGNVDADLADAIFQRGILGEIVYG